MIQTISQTTFQQLRSLQNVLHLDLSGNELTEFNADFGMLRAVRYLDVSSNKIEHMEGNY